jgi:hypothetical protein
MEALALDDSCIGKRAVARTRVAVMVSMCAASGSASVMIRNLSARGAMIESMFLPDVDERVELRRGEVSVPARVVWKGPERAGLQFDEPIAVSDWLQSSHAGQVAVDNLFQELKAGTGPAITQVKPAGQPLADPAHLQQTADGLESLADTLAIDPDVVERYLTELQVLDIAAQTMRKLAESGSR